jgi:PAS domain S-box-containing protein
MNKHRILVVEDEALIAANLVNVLTSLGYMVPEPVATGEDAVHVVKSQKPDLVLMDIDSIGEMNGIVAAEKIQSIAEIPVVFLTAYTDDLHLKQAQITEPYGYIVKPVESRELNATIEMALYKHALDRILKESEEKYRTVFENVGTAMVIVEENSIISLANKEFAQLTGFSKDDIEGKKSWTEFVVKEDLERMLAQHRLRRQDKKKTLTHYELRVVTKSGDIRTIYFSIDMIMGTTKSVASLLDITEHRQTEETLWEINERYRALFDRSLDCVYLYDLAGNFIDANQSALTLLGYNRNEIRSLNFASLLTPDQLPTALEANQEILTTGTQLKATEYRLKRKDGAYVTVLTTGSIIYQNKKPYAVQGIAHDITERKRVEMALRESEERYRILANTVHDAICALSPDGVVTYVNSEGAALIGKTPEKIVGLPLESLYHPAIAQEFRENLDAVIATKRPVRYDAQFWHENPSQVIWLDAQLVPQIGSDGSIIQVIGISRNITDRKQSEGLLKRFNQELEWQVHTRTAELEHANSLLETTIIQRTLAEESVRKSLHERELLLREIHHRVRNNLQIILSLIRLQLLHFKDPVLLETMENFQNRIMAMAHVHDRMCRSKDISRIDLSEIVTFLGTNLFESYNVSQQNIRLTVEMNDLQISIESAIPISMIINEIVSNSMKHAFPRGASGEITVSGQREGDTIVLGIRDTGIGMPKELDWRKSDQTLGFNLVVGLVQQLNGTINLDRSAGTSFTIVVKDRK